MNIYFGKQTVKLKKDFTEVSRMGFLFYFNLQYRSIYATLKLLAQFLFGSALWNNNYSETMHYYNLKNCREKQQKLANLRQKRYFKNELKHSQRFDHVTDDVMSLFWSWKKLSDRTLLFCKFSLPCDKRSTLYSPRPSLPTFSLMFFTPLNFNGPTQLKPQICYLFLTR